MPDSKIPEWLAKMTARELLDAFKVDLASETLGSGAAASVADADALNALFEFGDEAREKLQGAGACSIEDVHRALFPDQSTSAGWRAATLVTLHLAAPRAELATASLTVGELFAALSFVIAQPVVDLPKDFESVYPADEKIKTETELEPRRQRKGTGRPLNMDLANEILANQREVSLETVRAKMRRAVDECGLTLQAIGERMNYADSTAAHQVSRLIDPKTEQDLQLSTILAFARAIDHPPKDFF